MPGRYIAVGLYSGVAVKRFHCNLVEKCHIEFNVHKKMLPDSAILVLV